MLLHLGDNVSVPLDKLLFVLGERGMTPRTRAFIERAKRERRYEACAGAAKAYAVVREHGREVVYASIISPKTLEKRWQDEICRRYLTDAAVVTMELE